MPDSISSLIWGDNGKGQTDEDKNTSYMLHMDILGYRLNIQNMWTYKPYKTARILVCMSVCMAHVTVKYGFFKSCF